MPLLHNYVVDEILVPVVFLFFLVAGIFGVAMGVGLVVFRERAFRLFVPVDHWISARKKLHPMEVQHSIEPFVRKYRRWFSAFFIIGGTFSIFVLAAKVNAAAVASAFGARRFSLIGPLAAQSLTTLLIIGSVLAILTGIILGFLPQALGAIENQTDRWVSSRQMAKGVDDVHLPLDRWFQSSPRTAGCILAVAALILTVYSVIVLLGHR